MTSKAIDPEAVAELHRLVVERLTEFLAHGAPVQKPDAETGALRELGRAPVSAAYVAAAIRLLKEHGAFGASPEGLDPLLEDLPSFDDD